MINHTINPYGFPAKDRSGRLDMMEAPHLSKLMKKIKTPLQVRNQHLVHTAQMAEVSQMAPITPVAQAAQTTINN